MTRIIGMSMLLSFGIVTSAWSGDLGMAGALSGAGQGLGNALSQWQMMESQRVLQEDRARQERERDERLHRQALEQDRARTEAQLRYERQTVEAERQRLAEERAVIKLEHARAVLARLHPDWQSIVGLPETDGGPPPETAYRRWLATQPAEYQRVMAETWDPLVISDSIEKFLADRRSLP